MRPHRWNLVLAAAALLVLVAGVPLLAGQLRQLGGAPALADRSGRRIVTLEVEGLRSADCETRIRERLTRVPGVTAAEVRRAQRRAYVVAGREAGDSALVAAVRGAGDGYRAAIVQR